MWRGKEGIVVRVLKSVSVGGVAVAGGLVWSHCGPGGWSSPFLLSYPQQEKKSIRSLCVAAARSFKVAMLLNGRC